MSLQYMPFILGSFFSGVLAGLLTMGTLVIQPVSDSLPLEARIRFRQQMIPRLHALAPTLGMGALLSSLASAIFFSSGWSRRLLIFHIAMLTAAILITLLGNVPLNRHFLAWQPSTPPAHWLAMMRRWARYDQMRCGLCVLSFGCALLAWSLAATMR
jgi:hypothetical protein